MKKNEKRILLNSTTKNCTKILLHVKFHYFRSKFMIFRTKILKREKLTTCIERSCITSKKKDEKVIFLPHGSISLEGIWGKGRAISGPFPLLSSMQRENGAVLEFKFSE